MDNAAAREIFCFIAESSQRRVSKDILVEAFWPDEDPASIEKNFHPTISHIRKALNSRQSLKQNFIVFREGDYQLNPELSYSIDTEDFDRLIADAEAAKKEKDTEHFAARLNPHLRSTKRNLCRAFMTIGPKSDERTMRSNLTASCRRSQSSRLAKNAGRRRSDTPQTVVKTDPFREDMHRLMMKVLAAQSKPAAVKKQFEA